MDVRMPDGTIIRNVPEGITQGELARRIGKLEGAVEGVEAGAEGGFTAGVEVGAEIPQLFDPQGGGFDMERALAAGMTRATSGPNIGHMGSVAPVTPEEQAQFNLPEGSFVILKGRQHPTFNKAVEAEQRRGSTVVERGGRFFSVPVAPIPEPVMATREPTPAPTGIEAFTRAGTLRFLNNLSAIPEFAIQALMPRADSPSLIPGPLEAVSEGVRALTAERTPPPGMIPGPVQALTTAARTLTGGPVDPVAAAQNVRESVPGSLSGENILAGLGATAGALRAGDITQIPERFGQAQIREAERTALSESEAPFATGAGELAGDIATLLSGRAGGRGVVRAAKGTPKLNPEMTRRVLAEAAPRVSQAAQTTVERALRGLGRSAARTGIRAGETALEGAVLTALQGGSDEDIAQVAGAAAGSQVAGDIALRTYQSLRGSGGNVQGIAKALLLGTVVSLGAQQLTPGGLDRVLPTLEGVNQNIVLTYLLGGGAGVLAGGRVPQNFMGPAFAEIANVARRGVLFSALNAAVRDPVRTLPVIEKFTEDPDFFGTRARDLITRALNSERIDIRNTIDRLMKNREFRQKFETLER